MKPTRMEQLGNLLTAMIAVIVGGDCDLLTEPETVNSNLTITLLNTSRFRGIYSRVAKKLNVSPQHVREVALSRRRSARVTRALERELSIINKVGRAT
jgi:hypothetical protein